LCIVRLGLVVPTDGGVPLVSHAYPGNRPDVTQFGAMVSELAERFESLSSEGTGQAARRLTLVFDEGQNSGDNYELLESLPLHFVGSLPPSDHPDLLTVPLSEYRRVEGFAGLVAFEAEKTVFGERRRVVVTH